MKSVHWLAGVTVVLGMSLAARAQVGYSTQPYFQPEIDVVNSGAVLDVQATVSPDRKYVTMTMRPQMSQLLALREFTFQTGNPVQLPNGNAGGVNPVLPGPGGQVPQNINAPMRLQAGHGGMLLMRRGITPIISN